MYAAISTPISTPLQLLPVQARPLPTGAARRRGPVGLRRGLNPTLTLTLTLSVSLTLTLTLTLTLARTLPGRTVAHGGLARTLRQVAARELTLTLTLTPTLSLTPTLILTVTLRQEAARERECRATQAQPHWRGGAARVRGLGGRACEGDEGAALTLTLTLALALTLTPTLT